MNITKEQLEKYIEIQKRERGVQLTEKEAMAEASDLLTFVRAIYKLNPELSKKQIQPNTKRKITQNN